MAASLQLLLLAALLQTAVASELMMPPPPSPSPPNYYDDRGDGGFFLGGSFELILPFLLFSFVFMAIATKRRQRMQAIQRMQGYGGNNNAGMNGVAMTNLGNAHSQPGVAYGQPTAMPPQAGSMYGVAPQAGSMYGVPPQGGIVYGTSVGAMPTAGQPPVVIATAVAVPVDAAGLPAGNVTYAGTV